MQPPSIGQPALSVLVLLPASAHMTAQNASPLAPISRPPPLISRKSGSTVPSLKSKNPQNPSRLRHNDISPDERNVDPLNHVQAGRRSSLAPGLGAGTEIRSPELNFRHVPKLGAIESSPPGSPERGHSPSNDDHSGDDRKAAFGRYQLSDDRGVKKDISNQVSVPVLPPLSTEAPAFGSRSPLSSTSTSATGGRSRRRPQTSAVTRGGQSLQRGSMALPSGTGLGIGGGSGSRNRPGWEADEVVGHLRESGLEGMFFSVLVKICSGLLYVLFPPPSFACLDTVRVDLIVYGREQLGTMFHPFTPFVKGPFRE